MKTLSIAAAFAVLVAVLWSSRPTPATPPPPVNPRHLDTIDCRADDFHWGGVEKIGRDYPREDRTACTMRWCRTCQKEVCSDPHAH